MIARLGGTMLACGLLALTGPAACQPSQHELVDAIAFDQRIGAAVPANLELAGSDGAPHRLGALMSERPIVLALVWFDCPDLCPLTLDGLATVTRELPFSADQYRVVVASIDPADGPAQAARLRARLERRHPNVSFDNWRFLTGQQSAIERLAGAIGFEYAYDAEHDRFAHPAGFTIVAPGGTISRYLLGVRVEPRDLRLALLEAGRGELGSPVDQVLLRCYRFDPETGRYSLAVMSLVRGAAGLAVLILAVGVVGLLRRERR